MMGRRPSIRRRLNSEGSCAQSAGPPLLVIPVTPSPRTGGFIQIDVITLAGFRMVGHRSTGNQQVSLPFDLRRFHLQPDPLPGVGLRGALSKLRRGQPMATNDLFIIDGKASTSASDKLLRVALTCQRNRTARLVLNMRCTAHGRLPVRSPAHVRYVSRCRRDQSHGLRQRWNP
jgi:hypothetical protein